MGERHEAGAIALAIDDIFASAAAAPADQFAFRVCCQVPHVTIFSHGSNSGETVAEPLTRQLTMQCDTLNTKKSKHRTFPSLQQNQTGEQIIKSCCYIEHIMLYDHTVCSNHMIIDTN